MAAYTEIAIKRNTGEYVESRTVAMVCLWRKRIYTNEDTKFLVLQLYSPHILLLFDIADEPMPVIGTQ